MLPGAGTVNDCRLHADSLAYGGEAAGRLESGKVCFVPGLLPGEDAEITIIQEKKNLARGRLVRLISSAAERITPECPYFPECPGCAYIHCDYDTELKWKQRQFTDFLLRGKVCEEENILPPFGAVSRFGYRNKLKLHCSSGRFAMVAADNVSLIPIEKCLLADSRINEALKTTAVCGTSMTFRVTEHDGVVSFPGTRAPENISALTEKLPGMEKIEVAPDGFFQTNPAVAAELVRRAVKEIKDSGFDQLAELYCGVGVFSLAAALEIPGLHCRGVELNPEAIKAARRNAAIYGLSERCRFFSGDAGKLIGKAGVSRDCCLLVDPPRTGLGRQALDNIIAADPGKIIYISCAADTLRRDLQIFRENNWHVEKAGILDMFPGTAHFEALVTLIKQ